jgi:signal peptidase II
MSEVAPTTTEAEVEQPVAPNVPPSRPKGRVQSLAPSLVVAGLWLALDQLTKHWAVNHLADGHVDHLFWTLQFNLAFNSGMAFSRGRGLGPIIGVVALIVIVVLLLSLRRNDSRLGQVAVGMVIGGALGNVADRLFRGDGWLHGSVIDFIDPQWWPIFNVADIGVVVGGILLVFGAITAPPAEK